MRANGVKSDFSDLQPDVMPAYRDATILSSACPMPIYEFRCTTCGTHFDRLQKLSDPDPDQCPECGKATISRCLTAPSFRLAGSGWYETDFKKDGEKKHNLAAADEGAKAATEKPKADVAESKPAAKKAEKSPAEAKSVTPAASAKQP